MACSGLKQHTFFFFFLSSLLYRSGVWHQAAGLLGGWFQGEVWADPYPGSYGGGICFQAPSRDWLKGIIQFLLGEELGSHFLSGHHLEVSLSSLGWPAFLV